MNLKSQIKRLADDVFEETVAIRRHLHAHPELSFEEKETSAFVKEKLEKMGIEVEDGIGGMGLVGIIEGEKTGNNSVIALRADMDALPITEANNVTYCSQNPGVMHACGHDAHTASLLGAAKILQSVKSHFSGTVKLIFQPAEEQIPGGASLMIRDGVLRNPDVQSIFAQHVQPYLDCGKIGIRSGMYMASADTIHFTVKGKGGHAAHPDTFVDPVIATAYILTALQQVISRADPRTPSVLSFGKIRAEGAANIIPNEVFVAGTFRTMNEKWRDTALQKIENTIALTAKSMGCTVDINIQKGYPTLINDPALTQRNKKILADYVGEENLVELDIWMAAEDFAWYAQQIPGCFYRLGTGNKKLGTTHGLHTPNFNIDEEALRLSTGLMVWVAVENMG